MRIFLLSPSRLSAACLAIALGASIILLTPLLIASPAGAQNNPLAGRWSCSQAVHNTRNNFRSLAQYALLLYPNGRFQAQGTVRGGMGVSRFGAQGTWRVSQDRGAWWLSANGAQVTQFSTGQRIRGRHATFGRVYNTRYVAWRNLAPGGMQITLACRR
jgi:hypothetical protein